MYRKLGVNALIAASTDDVLEAKRLILPGIGAFDACISALENSGLRPALLQSVKGGVPLLGICVGMQMLTQGSEEGLLPGLSLVNARTRKFPPSRGLKIPHMGWNRIHWNNPTHPLARELLDEARFYFVHSYFVECVSTSDSLAECSHGVTFSAAIAHANVSGVQFHPEKSHRFGLRLLDNFACT